MKDEEIRNGLEETRKRIEAELNKGTEEAYQKLMAICQETNVKNLVAYDNGIGTIVRCALIWENEKNQNQTALFDQPIYQSNQRRIEDVVKFYNRVKLYLFRIESNLPDAAIMEGLQYISEKNISPEMLYGVITYEMEDRDKVLITVCNYLNSQKKYLTAYKLLLYRKNKEQKVPQEILLMIADMLLNLQGYDKAYAQLKEIEEPSEQVRQLKEMLKQYITQK